MRRKFFKSRNIFALLIEFQIHEMLNRVAFGGLFHTAGKVPRLAGKYPGTRQQQ